MKTKNRFNLSESKWSPTDAYQIFAYFCFDREKTSMHENLEKVIQELQDVKDKCEELRGAKQDAIRELLTLQEQQRAELRIINNSLMEETNARECLERRISELRTEVGL